MKHAVAFRINSLCQERTMTFNALANLSGVPPTTIYSILHEKSQNPGIITIKKICDGLGLTLIEFFDSFEFESLEEII